MKALITSLLISFFIIQATFAQNSISDKDAIRYVNQQVTVCGPIASTYFDSTSRRRPTFLNFRYPHPDETFTAIIWGDDRKNFPYAPEVYLKNKQVCINGKVILFHDQPEMVITQPEQIKIVPTSDSIR
ncbi:MAG: hypothetical protein IMW88_06760 [Thermoflavifilum sp.]|uniref:hypothetical protein n=1 Tax=Thermoflavifilum sp. TaxID=1968839 RepID=UPI0018A61D1D|nr:hypothetical protein [Thermoflavifilum sp.]QOR75081.1 MAG: hypothetical protein IMW88_06760 [Thermoflavifilum sp.]